METLVPAAICRHARIRVATERAMEFIDLTARIEALATASGIHAGLVNIQSTHTTTAIVVNEHEPLLLADFDAEQEDAVIVAADEMWRLWTAFFDRLALETGVGSTASAR